MVMASLAVSPVAAKALGMMPSSSVPTARMAIQGATRRSRWLPLCVAAGRAVGSDVCGFGIAAIAQELPRDRVGSRPHAEAQRACVDKNVGTVRRVTPEDLRNQS